MNPYKSFLKRLIDIFSSLTGLILLSPLLIILSVLLLIENRGNIFFCQTRPGKNARLFKLIKFKSMNDKKDKDGNLLPDHLRLTAVGKLIRKTSLDEIPQLINVIKGDMSLVGPRPLLVEYLPLYSEKQFHRHDIRPGITGWAQINGRNSISWHQKFEYDLWYVDHLSFFVDLKILFLTMKKVIKKKDIDFNAPAENNRFDGTN